MSNGFEKGDVVVLKSGGPKMTVSSVEGGEVSVVWFGKADKETHSVFGPELLLHERDVGSINVVLSKEVADL
ncbi:MAG: DUF2158 domain-containing protein [Pseudomonadota bacterium]|nr:DUF2158 domain-containing protein [Pseudomonadota bacterium]MEC8668193.1 DUF2158 domain-containing protein [Pseudomonadota bacterium]